MKLRGIVVGTWYVTSRVQRAGKVTAVRRDKGAPIVCFDFGKLGSAGLRPDEVTREALPEEIARAERRDRDRGGCVCRGLGAYVDWNGSTSDPAYEVRECADHAIPAGQHDKENAVEEDDRAAQRIDEALDAAADARDLLFPKGGRVAWVNGVTHDELLAVVQRLERAFEFLAPPPASAGEV